MTRGGGRRRASLTLYGAFTEPTDAMLDVESDLECPRTTDPTLPAVEALARPPG